MDLNTDFNLMTDEELDELITKAKETQERRLKGRKLDSWKKVMQAVQDYIIDFGMIELIIEDYNATLDADSFRIPGEIKIY